MTARDIAVTLSHTGRHRLCGSDHELCRARRDEAIARPLEPAHAERTFERGDRVHVPAPEPVHAGPAGVSRDDRTRGAFYAAAGDAAISTIDVRDLAEVAATALLEPGHDGVTYELTGPAALTHAELAGQLAAALGRPIAFVDVPPAAMRDQLLHAGVPAWQADGLLEDYAHYRRGEAAAVASGVEDVLGRAPRAFSDFARDFAAAFA